MNECYCRVIIYVASPSHTHTHYSLPPGIGGGTNEDLQENDIDFIEHTIAETEWIGGSVESSSDDYSEWVASVEEVRTSVCVCM
jgi:hypothetical protein